MLKHVRTINVADLELYVLPYRNRLKIAVLNTRIGQRDWPTAIQDAMLKAYLSGAQILTNAGEPFEIPLVDDVWGNERYVREFLASEGCMYPEKDRLLDLFFRLEMPDIARHFGR